MKRSAVRTWALLMSTLVIVAGCAVGTSNQALHPSPSRAVSPAASPLGTPSERPSPGTTSSPQAAPASLVRCTAPIPAGDNLIIGTLLTAPTTVVVRDIQDPANATNLCSFDSSAQAPEFANGGSVAYLTPEHQIIEADLASGATNVVASFGSGVSSVQYALSPDGSQVSYLDGAEWRFSSSAGSRLLSTLPAAQARGVNPTEDDSFLAFSPDGLYIALFQTFHVGGSGDSAPDQIRRASDGSLVYSASGMTMAVWTSNPTRLYFRDGSGNIHRWDPTAGTSLDLPIRWVRPRSSPDGQWIAYTVPVAGGVDEVALYSVQSNSVSYTSQPGRAGAVFVNNDLVWYAGERACPSCPGGQPQSTGLTYIYDVAGTTEVTSRLGDVIDIWPRYTGVGI